MCRVTFFVRSHKSSRVEVFPFHVLAASIVFMQLETFLAAFPKKAELPYPIPLSSTLVDPFVFKKLKILYTCPMYDAAAVGLCLRAKTACIHLRSLLDSCISTCA